MAFAASSTTQIAMMETGAADMMLSMVSKDMADLAAKGFNVFWYYTATLSLYPDSANPDSPLANQKVRQAISYAIDRAAIMKMSGFGYSSAAYQVFPPGNMGNIPGNDAQFDPDKARTLLKEAGYSNINLDLIPFPNRVSDTILVALQAYLKDVGINITIKTVTQVAYNDYRYNGWHNALIFQPTITYTNPVVQYFTYFVTPGQWPSVARPAGLTDLCTAALSTVNVEKDKVQAVIKLVDDNTMTIPVYNEAVASYIYPKDVINPVKSGNYANGCYATGADFKNMWLNR
jgi:ABC-type transport system substrate-binding protein